MRKALIILLLLFVAPLPGKCTLVAHGSAASSSGSPSPTVIINDVGSTLLVGIVSSNGGSPTIADNQGNTWTLATGTSSIYMRVYYCWGGGGVAPVTNAVHTYSMTPGSNTAGLQIFTFNSTSNTSNPFDVGNIHIVAGGSVSTFQPNSITPTQINEIIIAGIMTINALSVYTINSGFTLLDQTQSSPFASVGDAYLFDANTSAINPTWSLSPASSNTIAAIAAFKQSAAPTQTWFPLFGYYKKAEHENFINDYPYCVWY